MLVVAVWLGPTAQAMAWAFGAVVVWNVVQHMGLARIRPLECRLGPWLLTPALHREHHARTASGGTGNYGLLLAFWDRLFDTWQPPVEGTVVGVHDWRHGDDLLANLLSPVASDQAAGMTGEAPPR